MKQINQVKQKTNVKVFYMKKDAWRNAVENDLLNEMSGQHTVNSLKLTGFDEFAGVAVVELEGETSERVAELAFATFNDPDRNPLATPEGQQKIRAEGAGHTSMSVGDFVLLDNQIILVCMDKGWKSLSIRDVIG